MCIVTSITEEKNSNECYVIQKKYDIHEGQYGAWEKKGKDSYFVPKGSAVYVKRIIYRIDTGEQVLELFFYDSKGKKIETILPRKELTEQGIMVLLGYGVQVVKQDAKILITSIMNQEPDAPFILQHEKLGFVIYDTHLTFLAEKAIGVESTYKGKLLIGKTGKYTTWEKMVKKKIIGNIPLEFILAVAGSGIVVDYLREKVQVDNVIVSLVGESSSGKSTAGLFMVSCGAKPDLQGNSLAFNFSDTQNALLASIPSSYPVLIDEGSLINYNPTKLLYSLAMGTEKKRLNDKLEKKESAYFSTAIAITSEKSLLNIADDNTGLLVRILEIQNVKWTRDAETADLIKDTIQNNYGWLIPKLAEKILEFDGSEDNMILTVYKEWYELLVERAKEQGTYNSLTERACKQYALIMLSASLIESVMNIELHTDEIIEFIEEHSPVKEADRANIGSRALNYLMQYITKNYSNLIHPEDTNFTPLKCVGRIKNVGTFVLKNGDKCSKRLYISDVMLEEILREGKFPDKKVILKKWKEMGLLKCEKDRYLSDIVIADDISVKGYIINLPNQKEEENEN